MFLMKKSIIIAAYLLCAASLSGAAQSSVLRGVLGRSDASNLNTIVKKITGMEQTQVSEDMAGDWVYYDSELVCKNNEYLAKAGGPVPLLTMRRYTNTLFSRISINDGWTFSFNDGHFVQTILIAGEVVDLKGTYTFDEANLTMTFVYESKSRLKFGTVNAIYANTGDNLYILYSSDAFLKVLNKASQAASSYTKNAVITTLTSYLETYDGLLVGYKMRKPAQSQQEQ